MKVVAVIIPSWHAAIPKDWELEVKAVADEEWSNAAGKTLIMGQGDMLRVEPSEEPHTAQVWLEGALQHQFVREVTDANC